jgi:hypothetical protein
MRFRSPFSAAVPLAVVLLAACSSSSSSTRAPTPSDAALERESSAITSVQAKILDFTFDGEVIADGSSSPRQAVVRQLLYTFGVLNSASNASGQVGSVHLTDVSESSNSGQKHVRYRATMPVAWPKDDGVPSSYSLVVPRDSTALSAFDGKYDGRCGTSAHGKENFWHDWNPNANDCSVDDLDVVRSVAAIAPHSEADAKYPEYDQIWEDGRLDAVAIFTIISESGDTPPNDWGFTEAHRFVRDASQALEGARIEANGSSGSILEDVTIRGGAMVGGSMRDVALDVLVVRSITGAGEDFDARYDALSEKADLILFNGHAQLGGNTNALGRKGKVTPGKYQLVLLNACDTFALVDDTMLNRRRDTNGAASDPEGTRFLDVISNARPGRADNLANVSNAVYSAVLRADAPITYSHMIREMPSIHMVVVYGEEDNVFGSNQMPYAAYEQTSLSGGR